MPNNLPETLEGFHRCLKNKNIDILCGELSCTLDCEIYQRQSGYTADLMDYAIENNDD